MTKLRLVCVPSALLFAAVASLFAQVSPPTGVPDARTRLTPDMVSGRQFHFTWKKESQGGDRGILTLNNDGTIGRAGNFHETAWTIDQTGRLVIKFGGYVSTVFTNAQLRNGRWFLTGQFRDMEQVLEEASPELVAREKRTLPLSDALHDFQSSNDQESASFVSGILASLDQPGGMTPRALALAQESMKNRVRELFKRGAMQSAGTMNHAQTMAFFSFDFPAAPKNANQKSGGPPGPGGLVLYFPFDKPAGADGVIHDESGAGNDGKVFGAQWVADGKFGGAYRFSLADFEDRIVIPNSDSLNAEEITLAMWIKASAAHPGIWERIMDKDFYHGFAISLAGDVGRTGKLAWETGNGDITSSNRADDNQWHHVAAVYDGRTVRCYLDGAESSRQARKPGRLGQSGWDLCIGNSVVDYGWGELMAFDGLVDDARVYARALSAADIKALASANRAGADILTATAASAHKGDTAARLKELQSLYDQGLIDKEDYEMKKKEIMNSL